MNRKRFIAAGLALIPAVFTPLGALAEREAVAFGVNRFGGTDQCGGSSTDDLSYCDNFAEEMDDRFDRWISRSKWDQSVKYTNSAVDGRDWSDASKMSFGEDDADPRGADHADVAMICSHGSRVSSGSSHYSSFLMGDDNSPSNDCRPNTRDHMLMGNGSDDLEIGIGATCFSANLDVFDAGGYFDMIGSSGSFNTWLGFHGISYDGSTATNNIEDFFRKSYSDGLGENWIDEMYRTDVRSTDDDGSTSIADECPAVVTFCEKYPDCTSQFTWAGFDDRFKVTSSDTKNRSLYFYVEGCDPLESPALPVD